MISITRRFTFSAGHRLGFHEGCCKELHGHNYVVEATFARLNGGLDDNRMVVDFNTIKNAIGDWFHANWDHCMILDADDCSANQRVRDGGFKVYSMLGPPTAENMALELFEDIIPNLFDKHNLDEVECLSVVVWENENSKATASQ